MGADEGALLQHGEGDWHTGARIGPHKNTWWTDASPHGLTEGGKKISGKCKGGKGRLILLTAPCMPTVHHGLNFKSESLARGGGEVTLANLFRRGRKVRGRKLMNPQQPAG